MLFYLSIFSASFHFCRMPFEGGGVKKFSKNKLEVYFDTQKSEQRSGEKILPTVPTYFAADAIFNTILLSVLLVGIIFDAHSR